MRVRPAESWVLPVTINTVRTNALLDTGAGLCLLSKAVYEQMPKSKYHLRPGKRDIKAVGLNTLPTIGEIDCDVLINGKEFPIDMVVSSEDESIGCILGMDFLLGHDCEIKINTGHLVIGNMKLKLRKESATNCVARVKLESDVLLPPRTELAVSGRPEYMRSRISTYYSCVEPSQKMHKLARDNILTGCSVVPTMASNIVVPLMNTGDEARVLKKGTVIAVMRGTTQISVENYPYDPLGLGRDRVQSKVNKVTVTPESDFVQPHKVFDHVAPLMNDIASDICSADRTCLQETLLEFADVLVRGPTILASQTWSNTQSTQAEIDRFGFHLDACRLQSNNVSPMKSQKC